MHLAPQAHPRVRLLTWPLPSFGRCAALGIVLACAASPQAAPTIGGVLGTTPYSSVWSVRLGPANVFELFGIAIVGAWLAAQALAPCLPIRRSAFDTPLLITAALLGLLQTVALLRGLPSSEFLAFDLERILIPLAGYLLVTRAVIERATWSATVWLLAFVLLGRAAELVVVHGVLGTTQFGTSRGQTALLITEDTLLVIVPAVLLWGRIVEQQMKSWLVPLAVMAVASVLIVDALSLRRGALLFILAALAVRSLSLTRRTMLAGVATLLVVAGTLVAAGPLRSTWDNARYAVASAVGARSDASTQQRGREWRELVRNFEAADAFIGRGAGTPWTAFDPGPVGIASFGTGESVTKRIGWHAYGLDWLFKFGVLGCLLAIAGLLGAMRVGFQATKGMSQPSSTDARSLIIVLAPLALLLFTNPRVGLLAGVVLGLISTSIDLERAHARTPEANDAQCR